MVAIGLLVVRQSFGEGGAHLDSLVGVQRFDTSAGARPHGTLPVRFEVGVTEQVRIRNDLDS